MSAASRQPDAQCNHCLVGAAAAALITLPAVAVAVIGWFVKLPPSASETVWASRDAALGISAPGRGVQALVLLGWLAVAGLFGAVGAAVRRRRGTYDRHSAAAATRGGLAGFMVLCILAALASNVAFRGARDIDYLAFGPGGTWSGTARTAALLFALVTFFSLARRDTWFGRVVWRLTRVPPAALVGGPPAVSARAWPLWQTLIIALCLGLTLLLGVATVPIAVKLAVTGPSNAWSIVAFVGSVVGALLVLSTIALALQFRGYHLAGQEEERAAVTRWRSDIFVRRPMLAGLLVALGTGLAASLALRSGVLNALEAPMAEQLLRARRWCIRQSSVALAPSMVRVALLLPDCRPARLAGELEMLAPTGDEDMVALVHASFGGDLKLGTAFLRSRRPRDNPEDTRFVVRPFAEEMKALERTLQGHNNVFFWVDGEQTDPQQYGAPSARIGWFEAEGRDAEQPFHARLCMERDGALVPSLPVLVAAHLLGIPADQVVPVSARELRVGTATLRLDRRGSVLVSGRRSMTPDDPGRELPPDLRDEVKDVLPTGGYVPVYVVSPSVFADPGRDPRTQFRLDALDRTIDALVAELLPSRVPHLRRIVTECRLIRPAPLWADIALVWVLCLWGALMGAAFRPLHAAALTLHLGVIVLYAAIIVVTLFSIRMQTAVPLLAMLAVWAGGSHVTQVLVERRRNQVTSALGRYVTQQVADEILSCDEITLGGETRRATVMFADIRGFGRLTERMAPQEVVSVLNDYLTAMIDVVFEHGGTLDKFIGDALMAVWGAPIEQPDDAANAVRAAVALRDRIATLSRTRAEAGLPVAEIAIGINTGEVVAGNVGDIRRMEYTVIGDEVVVAARLQAVASAGPAQILIGESTYMAVADLVTSRPLGPVPVRHRDQPVEVYEVLGMR
jgi:class 3 adenylate cyclase